MTRIDKNYPVDIVLTWVDGSDPDWLREKAKYENNNLLMNGDERYRDWDNLQYLFRGIETHMPWVNKIFFVTWGHLPKWLDLSHPKLVVVRHDDFLPAECLPVFNINPIEINFHRIRGLSEHFIYFNDDCFVLKPMQKEHFFKEGLPVNAAICNVMHEGVIAPIILNDIDLINKNFNRHKGEKLNKRQIMLKSFWKWFNPSYGKGLINNLLLLYWKTFTGFLTYHQAQPFLKSTYEKVWSKESEVLERVTSSRFRDNTDVNQYLFRYWQFAEGNFFPDSYRNAYKKRLYIELRTLRDVKAAANVIEQQQVEMICLNDAMSKGRFTEVDVSEKDFCEAKRITSEALSFLTKSQYEI